MNEIKETTYKGTRILIGNEKRKLINSMIEIIRDCDDSFQEISMPVIQLAETFQNKVGEENNNMMYTFTDKGNRNLCLAPEYTAIIQQLAKTTFKQHKDVHLYYIQECFRGEKPQSGRYRQFTQVGVEIINPTKDYTDNLIYLATELISAKKGIIPGMVVNRNVTRGLDYYEDGKGFEVICPDAGNAKQIVGGGTYEGGQGFALGLDRLLTLK